MFTVVDMDAVTRIADLEIRKLVKMRFTEICNGDTYNCDRHGLFIVIEPGDTAEAVEQESGCGIVHNLLDETSFGDPDFSPNFEVLEEHPSCYEMVFVLNDDGFGVLIFIPKRVPVDRELLSLCRTYAVKPLKRRRS